MEISTGHHQATPNINLDQQKKSRSQPEQALRCPRCDSTNTKFCYYNNYSLSQPRYFCKGCRRYWTKGGSLRNVPIGGGCRKNKRSNSNSPQNSSKKQSLQNNKEINIISPTSLLFPSLNPPLSYENNVPVDLSLAFSSFHNNDPFIIRNGDYANSFYNYGISGDDYRGLDCYDGVGCVRDSTEVVGGNSEAGSSGNSTGSGDYGRDYWSGGVNYGVNYGANYGVNCSWQGIINSSLL